MNKINYYDFSQIPEHMMKSIRNYVEKGHPLGGFLFAVFSHDLFKAVSGADDTNIHLLPMYVKYIWNECPSDCHGSGVKIKKWIEEKQKGQQIVKNGMESN